MNLISSHKDMKLSSNYQKLLRKITYFFAKRCFLPWSVVYDECRLCINNCFRTIEAAKPLLVDLSVAADDGVVTFRNRDLRIGIAGIEDHDDVAPVIATCVVLQTIGQRLYWGVKELQMLPDEIGTAQTEGGMVLTKGNQILVVVEHLRVFRLVAPIQMVDAVR